MTRLKAYNSVTSEWELVAVGGQGAAGEPGAQGPEGPQGVQGEPGLPTGAVSQFAGSIAPSGFVLCTGQSLSTTTFANLFAVIGYTYGGSGSNFLVPNLQNRVPVGRGSGTFTNLNATGGSETVTLGINQIPAHTHNQNAHSHTGGTSTDGNHSHGMQDSYNQGSGTSGPDSVFTGRATQTGWGDTRYIFAAGAHSHSFTTNSTTATNQNTGGGEAHNNLQPYIVLNYIIKT